MDSFCALDCHQNDRGQRRGDSDPLGRGKPFLKEDPRQYDRGSREKRTQHSRNIQTPHLACKNEKDIARNNILNDSFLRAAYTNLNFSTDYNRIPKNGEKVIVGNQELKWYALDSKLFNFKLYRFAYAINKPQNGVLFWVTTVINCTEDIEHVRMAAGCNSAGTFWLNGTETLMIPGDKDMVVDYSTSTRITLHKGKNIIRGAVMNGPGMIDFCLRFIDEKGEPVKKFTVSYE